MGIPGNLGNSQGHFIKPGIPLSTNWDEKVIIISCLVVTLASYGPLIILLSFFAARSPEKETSKESTMDSSSKWYHGNFLTK